MPPTSAKRQHLPKATSNTSQKQPATLAARNVDQKPPSTFTIGSRPATSQARDYQRELDWMPGPLCILQYHMSFRACTMMAISWFCINCLEFCMLLSYGSSFISGVDCLTNSLFNAGFYL